MNRLLTQTANTARRFVDDYSVSCQKLASKIQSTKVALLSEFRQRVDTNDRMLRLALNEAEAIALETGFPLLTFPTLAREKAEAVAAWQTRQQVLRHSSEQSLAA